jgi:NADH-quinone oxidoreductase subunit L
VAREHAAVAAASADSDGHGSGSDGTGHRHGSPHESPWSMLGPLFALAALAAVAGFVGTPYANWFGHTVRFGGEAGHPTANYLVMALSTAAALSGIGLGVFLYSGGQFRLARLERSGLFSSLYRLSKNKLWFDEIYWRTLVEPLLTVSRLAYRVDQRLIDAIVNGAGAVTVGLAKAYRIFDVYIVDGIVNLVGWVTKQAGSMLRYAQTGQVQNYVLVLIVGAILLVWLFLNV